MFAGYRVEMSRIVEGQKAKDGRNYKDVTIIKCGHFDTMSNAEAKNFANHIAQMDGNILVEIYAIISTRTGTIKIPEADIKDLLRDLRDIDAVKHLSIAAE